MQRPSWLRWPGFRLSVWSTIALLVMGMPSLIVLFIRPLTLALPRLQAGYALDPLQLAHEIANTPSPAWLNVYALVIQAALLWFTFFSGSLRVKECDKFWVFVALCFSAVSWLLTLGQWAGL